MNNGQRPIHRQRELGVELFIIMKISIGHYYQSSVLLRSVSFFVVMSLCYKLLYNLI